MILFDHLSEVAPERIIYEVFHWRQGQLNAVFTGVEYIGVIELWAQTHSAEVVRITPSDGKGFWDDKKIKALGLYIPSVPHGIDALRLWLTYKMKTDVGWKSIAINQLKRSDSKQ